VFKNNPRYVSQVLRFLKKNYPNAKIVLNFSNNWELLVAVMLSAQCTDKMVNKVTAKLFPKYREMRLPYSSNEVRSSRYARTVIDEAQEMINFVEVDVKELEQDVRSTGFYRNKAKHIIAAAKMIRDKFGGKLPRTMEELLQLPGVARKTANIVLGNAYGIVEGVAVDTHVRRVSRHFGLTDHANPDKIEQDLMRLFDKKDWFKLTYLLIEYGRNVHTAKRPIPCSMGPLAGL
jgi:endonuclease-3